MHFETEDQKMSLSTCRLTRISRARQVYDHRRGRGDSSPSQGCMRGLNAALDDSFFE